jgi:hypothetical protein
MRVFAARPAAALACRRLRSRCPQPPAAARRAAAAAAGSPDDTVPLRGAPPGLEGLRLTPEGELVDERGKALNALGATRFDVAVQAMRGAFPGTSDAAASNERATGQMLDALVKFPTDWLFQTVARVPPAERDAFAAEVAALVRAQCGPEAVLPDGVSHAAKGATWVAVRVKARVTSSAAVAAVVDALRRDARVKMAS